jgi:hypothetical protein
MGMPEPNGARRGLMNATRKISFLMRVAFLSVTASFAQQVKTDYDRNTNFTGYKTYSWENVQTENPLWVDRIKAAVDASLSAKGWTKVQSAGDVSIMAMEINQSHQTLNTYYDNLGAGWGWRGWGGLGDNFGESTTTENTYQVGTLVVDLFDSHTKKLIWRGSASDTLSDKSARNIKNLDKGVQKIFDHFPPDTQRARR